MLVITVYAEQKKRHRCIEQSFRLCGRSRCVFKGVSRVGVVGNRMSRKRKEAQVNKAQFSLISTKI